MDADFSVVLFRSDFVLASDWGTRKNPAPTLGLEKQNGAECTGCAEEQDSCILIIFMRHLRVWEDEHALTESVSSLRKGRYDEDKVLDLGRYQSARVEFAAAPRCSPDVCPDSGTPLTIRDKASRNACGSRQDRLMGLARSRGLTGTRGLAAAPCGCGHLHQST